LTFYDNMTLNSTFCDRIDFKNFSEKVWKNQCFKPCEQTFYKTIQSEIIKQYKY
jgi:hypothetical protein